VGARPQPIRSVSAPLKNLFLLPSYSGKGEGSTSIDLPSIYSSVRAGSRFDRRRFAISFDSIGGGGGGGGGER